MDNKIAKLEKVRSFLREKNAEGIIVSSWQNVLYLSGFTGYNDAVLLVTNKNAFIITDSRYYVQAEEQAPEFELVKGNAMSPDVMKKLLEEQYVSSVMYENKAISYNDYFRYYEALGVKLKKADNLFGDMRLIKTPEEIMAVEKACDLASEALVKALPEIKAGKTEIEIAAALEYNMRVAGAEKTSFETIVASGARGAMPHGTASKKVLEQGEGITIDFGAFFGGVCSDMTRTFFLGEPCPEMRKIYNVVLEAQTAAIEGYRPGMTGGDVDRIARDVIKDAGYGEYFGHGLGHGVGIDVHEVPNVSPKGSTVLEPGMIFSIEPGIYVPDLGGVRIEDLVTIENGSLRILTKSPAKELTML